MAQSRLTATSASPGSRETAASRLNRVVPAWRTHHACPYFLSAGVTVLPRAAGKSSSSGDGDRGLGRPAALGLWQWRVAILLSGVGLGCAQRGAPPRRPPGEPGESVAEAARDHRQ